MTPVLDHLGLVTVGDELAFAVVSADDRYRYILGRTWPSTKPPVTDFAGHRVDQIREHATFAQRPVQTALWASSRVWLFGMLNPSTARVEDDHTVRKCIGFAKRGGADGIFIVNAMAYSTPYPPDLVEEHKRGGDVFGPHNEAAIQWVDAQTRTVRRIAAWGIIPPKVRPLAARGTGTFMARPAECLGVNLDASPRHPLMLGYDTSIVPYEHARSAS